MENAKKEIQMKLLLIGDQAVGKSSLMYRYVHDEFTLNMMGTAGVDLKKKTVTINNDQIKVMIYDTAGHDRFRTIAKNQYRGSHGIIIIYDVTDRKTFDAVTFWMKSITEHADSGVEVLLIGNKIDLVEERAVSSSEGKAVGEQYKVPFIETSAKNAENVASAFTKIITTVYEKFKSEGRSKTTINTFEQKVSKSNKCCCFK